MDADSRVGDHGAAPTLRKDSLSMLENVAQTLGIMAPTGTLGVIIPLLIGKTGNGTWLMFLAVLGICLLILVNINGFATRCASAGGLGTYARLGLGSRAGVVTGWIYIGGMLFGAASSGPSAAYYACLVISEYTGIPNTPLLGATVTTLVILAAWWTAFKDMKLSGDVMIVIEVTSLSVMFAIIAIAMSRNGPWIDRPQLTLQGAGPRAFSAGLVLCFLTMAGFESATTLGEDRLQAELLRDRQVGLGGDSRALAIRPVTKPMIGADHLLAFHPSVTERNAPVDADVLCRDHAPARAVKHELLVEKRR